MIGAGDAAGMNTPSANFHAAPAQTAPVDALVRLPAACSAAGVKRSKLYADIQDSMFTPPVKAGRTSLWPASEIAAINAARIAGWSDDEIRALVKKLIEARADKAKAVSS